MPDKSKFRNLSLSICLCLLTAYSVSAQNTKHISDGQLPAPVRTEFKKLFPVVKAHWQKVEDTLYVARFLYHKEKYIYRYHQGGQLIEQLKRIKLSDVPNAIRIQIYNSYPGISELAFYHLTKGREKFIYADIQYIQDKKVMHATESFPMNE